MSRHDTYRERLADGLASGPFTPDWSSLRAYEPPNWYVDGKFGIFIHWGPYTVPAFANEWYARNMYVQGRPEYEHHLATYGPHREFGYKDFIPQFTADAFDADEWAGLFRQAGAQFVVPVAEHHDGFAMYDCGFSRWKATEMGPRRDVIGELAEAVRRQWLVFGLSTHRAEHWWFMNGGMAFDSDVRDPRFADFYGPAQNQNLPPNEEFLDDWLFRCVELVDKYHPQLVWFDWWIEQPVFAPYLQRFAAYYYNRGADWGRGVAINYKHAAFADGTAVYDVERGQLAQLSPSFWQTDTSVSKGSWSWVPDHDYKQLPDLIADLVDVVSKNGALLLNIGPRADGTIAEPERELLRGIGDWLRINGEAIYGTRPWTTFGEGPTPVSDGSFTDTLRAAYTGDDIRFTTRGDTLYAIALAWPNDHKLTIATLGYGSGTYEREIASVELLGHDGTIEWKRAANALIVRLPKSARTNGPVTLKITPHQ